jgi:hypothetical protein
MTCHSSMSCNSCNRTPHLLKQMPFGHHPIQRQDCTGQKICTALVELGLLLLCLPARSTPMNRSPATVAATATCTAGAMQDTLNTNLILRLPDLRVVMPHLRQLCPHSLLPPHHTLQHSTPSLPSPPPALPTPCIIAVQCTSCKNPYCVTPDSCLLHAD